MSQGHVEPKKIWDAVTVGNSATAYSSPFIIADCSRASFDLIWASAMDGTITVQTTNDPRVRDNPTAVTWHDEDALACPADPDGAITGVMWHLSELNCLAVRLKLVTTTGGLINGRAHAKA